MMVKGIPGPTHSEHREEEQTRDQKASLNCTHKEEEKVKIIHGNLDWGNIFQITAPLQNRGWDHGYKHIGRQIFKMTIRFYIA